VRHDAQDDPCEPITEQKQSSSADAVAILNIVSTIRLDLSDYPVAHDVALRSAAMVADLSVDEQRHAEWCALPHSLITAMGCCRIHEIEYAGYQRKSYYSLSQHFHGVGCPVSIQLAVFAVNLGSRRVGRYAQRSCHPQIILAMVHVADLCCRMIHRRTSRAGFQGSDPGQGTPLATGPANNAVQPAGLNAVQSEAAGAAVPVGSNLQR
jgi:hypothetical protein